MMTRNTFLQYVESLARSVGESARDLRMGLNAENDQIFASRLDQVGDLRVAFAMLRLTETLAALDECRREKDGETVLAVIGNPGAETVISERSKR